MSNDTLRGDGGGIYFAPTSTGTIEDSVITANATDENTGGIHLESAVGTGGTVTLARTIVAKNLDDGTNSPDVYAGTNRMLISQGNNRFTTAGGGPGFVGHASDHVGSVDYIVTGVSDTYHGTSDPVVMSLRDAVHLANTTAGTQEIWLPAWSFVLTRDRAAFGGGSPTDTVVSFGDLDIDESVTIRGVDGFTSVDWRLGIIDKTFELLGDFEDDGMTQPDGSVVYDVDGDDFLFWQHAVSNQDLAADGDDDGDVDSADLAIWEANVGNLLTLRGVVA